MTRKTIIAAALASGLAFSTPAHATWGNWGNWGGWGSHTHSCGCGHQTCNPPSGTSGGSSSGGSDVPEPGVLGLMGLGLMGVGYARRRKRR